MTASHSSLLMFLDHPVAQDPGVVHQDVETPELVERQLSQLFAALEARDVAVVRDGLAPLGDDLVGHLARRSLVAPGPVGRAPEVVHDHGRSLSRERERLFAADPATGPGDNGDFPFQPHRVLLLSHPPGAAASRRSLSPHRPRADGRATTLGDMKVTRIYTGDDGESHFEDVEIPLEDRGRIGSISALLPATGVFMRETEGDYELDFHNAPRRQYVVNLDAAVEIETGDGTVRRIGPGEILLAEDTTGRGHISRSVDSRPRRSLFITLD